MSFDRDVDCTFLFEILLFRPNTLAITTRTTQHQQKKSLTDIINNELKFLIYFFLLGLFFSISWFELNI